MEKQGSKGPQKLSSLKSLKIHRYWIFDSRNHQKWLPCQNFWWQIRKERQNRSTNNGYIIEKAKRLSVGE